MTRARSPLHVVIVLLVCCAAALVVLSAPVRYTAADPQGTFLVGQQLLTRGTPALDDLGPPWTGEDYRTVEVNGQHYYYFPPGAPLTAVPAVAVALATGFDIVQREQELQIIVSALLAALTVLLLYALARFFLGFGMSLALAAVFWAGTPLASTNGTAFWSHGAAVVYALAALIAMLGITERSWRIGWVVVAPALAMAIMSRPTMTVFAAAVLTYLWVRDSRSALRATVLLAALLGLAVVLTWGMTGSPVPPYYLPGRLSGGDLVSGLAGVLASPSRGALVYLPWLVLLALTAWLTRSRWTGHRLLVALNLGWVLALVLVVSRFPLWYGGTGYGPRLLTEALPSLFLVLVVVWPPRGARGWVPLITAWSIVAVVSVGMHLVSGLYNPATIRWGTVAGQDMSAFVNDWRYPQFLHTAARDAERQQLYDRDPPDGRGYRDLPLP